MHQMRHRFDAGRAKVGSHLILHGFRLPIPNADGPMGASVTK